MQELEERQGQLLEENQAISEEHNQKVTELTQLGDEVESLRRRLEESDKARADDKVYIILLVFFISSLRPLTLTWSFPSL